MYRAYLLVQARSRTLLMKRVTWKWSLPQWKAGNRLKALVGVCVCGGCVYDECMGRCGSMNECDLCSSQWCVINWLLWPQQYEYSQKCCEWKPVLTGNEFNLISHIYTYYNSDGPYQQLVHCKLGTLNDASVKPSSVDSSCLFLII